MLTVALTGGIAAGKSVVARVFEARGCVLFRADEVARRLIDPGGPAVRPLIERFGQDIAGPDGGVDRQKLAAIVFGDPAGRADVNRVVHPLVEKARRAEVARLEAEGRTEVFVSEAALTIEAGLEKGFDKVVVVWCPADLQIARLMGRDGLGREEACRRMAAQMPSEDKLRYADYVVDASGSLERTLAQAEAVYAKLLEDAAAKKKGKRVRP
ncbi:MAG: dephospho-CoA kinase [Candidatus Aminicenantes bacterium]|nr:dephospho-CoA kinase [Candidatus Aminicenantes bacterium]